MPGKRILLGLSMFGRQQYVAAARILKLECFPVDYPSILQGPSKDYKKEIVAIQDNNRLIKLIDLQGQPINLNS